MPLPATDEQYTYVQGSLAQTARNWNFLGACLISPKGHEPPEGGNLVQGLASFSGPSLEFSKMLVTWWVPDIF